MVIFKSPSEEGSVEHFEERPSLPPAALAARASQLERHEYPVRIGFVVAERLAVSETKTLVQPLRGYECLHGACLETDALVAALPRNGNDMRQHGTARSSASKRK